MVIIRDMVEVKSRCIITQCLLERVLALQGDTADQISDLRSKLKEDADRVAIADTVQALKQVYPDLPDSFFRKYLYES